MTDPLRSAKIRPWHLERSAIVFIRQSDPQQPVKHPESTARQYGLVDRAVALGWQRDQVIVIDEDQGKSGSSAEGRLGFHRLLAEVALDHVGLILGLEVSRPARNCKDWHQLLELCGRFRTLLADEALRQQRQAEEEFEGWQRSAPARLTAQDEEAIRALAADLPAVWRAETTTPQDRQRVARLLLERVTVTVDKGSERVDVKLHWVGGQVTEHVLKRQVSGYAQLADYRRLKCRLEELSSKKLSSSEIANCLNAEGFRPPKRAEQFTSAMVLRLVNELGLARRRQAGSAAGLGPDEYRPASLARELGVNGDTLKRWLRVGWVNVRRDEEGYRVIWADADELRRLRELMRTERTWANKERLAELRQPKQRPAQ